MAYDLVMSQQISPWSPFRSPPDMCADHPLICVQINPWSACRSTPDLRADQGFICKQIRGWSACRSGSDRLAHHMILGFVEEWLLEYQMVTKTILKPTYLTIFPFLFLSSFFVLFFFCPPSKKNLSPRTIIDFCIWKIWGRASSNNKGIGT